MSDLTLVDASSVARSSAMAVEQDFAARLGELTLVAAMHEYQSIVDRLGKAALGERRPACSAGCPVCCHQTIVVSFLELAWIYFSDENRFRSFEFQAELQQAMSELWRIRDVGQTTPLRLMAARQFARRTPCVLLGPDGSCSVHQVKPAICRNAWSEVRCTWTNMPMFAFPDISYLAKRLRDRIHERYELGRCDTDVVKTRDALFYLPEGLDWLMKEVPLDDLRPLFAS